MNLDDDSQYYIAQFHYGIIPFDYWAYSLEAGISPFSGMSKPEQRRAKRKYRKLKRKVFGQWKASGKKRPGVKKYISDPGKYAWFNLYLISLI